MKKIIYLAAIILICIAFFLPDTAYSQVPVNSFILNASFSRGWSDIGIGYTFSESIEVAGGLGLKNVSYSVSEGEAPESENMLTFYGYGLYFLNKGEEIHPFLRVVVQYWTDTPEKTSVDDVCIDALSTSFTFGGKVFITKGIALVADVGLQFNMIKKTTTPISGDEYSITSNELSTFTSSVGISFYF
jgi:hypothetical protein